jgi:hypothetical protein
LLPKIVASAARRGYADNGQLNVFSTGFNFLTIRHREVTDTSNNPFERGPNWNLTLQGELLAKEPQSAATLMQAAGMK